MEVMVVIWALTLVAGASVTFFIAADKRRFLAQFELSQWRENIYLRGLPNFLQALYDHRFNTPWPRRCHGLSASLFCFRTGRLLRKRPRSLRHAFLRQHVTLFGLLEILKPYLHDFILSEQQRIAGKRVAEMEDTADRDRLLNFIEAVRQHRERFHKALTEYDHRILIQVVERRLIATLRAAHSVFQEHGFSLMREFNELRRWEQMTGSELSQELPSSAVYHGQRKLWRVGQSM